MLVYVLNVHGDPLMPCKPAKARLLLKEKKAKVTKRTPFTIQLLYGSSGYKQQVTLGVDSGYKYIGLSAITEKEELYSEEVELRSDMVKLNSERRMYRKARRSRHHWYRKPRFLNRKKESGWLAPSIQHKLDSHIKIINLVKGLLPVSRTIVEVAAFDIQKIKNPEINGAGYQEGEQQGFWNAREYALYRDGHTCQHCKSKSGDKVLEVHHLESRQTGGDRPGNLLTLCSTCHDRVSANEIKLKVKPSKGFRVETFMSMVRWRLVNLLKECGEASHTYGYVTKSNRIKIGIGKSHVNDAFVIAGGVNQTRNLYYYFSKQVRKCNRKLFKGARSHIKNTAAYIVKGFRRFDRVIYRGVECFVFGRRVTGYFALRTAGGITISTSAKYNQLRLVEKAKTLLTERRQAFPPTAKAVGLHA